jgi:hypothetical protein
MFLACMHEHACTHTHTKFEVTYKLWDNNMEKGSIPAGVTVSQSLAEGNMKKRKT